MNDHQQLYHLEVLDAIEAKNGRYVSGTYTNNRSEYVVVCRRTGNPWRAFLACNIIHGKYGCSCCIHLRSEEHINTIASKFGAKCLNEGPKFTSDILQWEAKCGHIIKESLAEVTTRGLHCGICRIHKHPVENFNKLAREKGWTCLEVVEERNMGYWKCNTCNYEWKQLYAEAARHEKCLQCKRVTMRHTLEHVKEAGDKQGFICLSASYARNDEPLHWQCKKNPEHMFDGTYASIVDRLVRCPRCRESRGARQARLYLEEIGLEFEGEYSLKKLGFPIADHRNALRFDFYLPTVRLGIEIDGPQHEQSMEIYGGEKTFHTTIRCDAKKNTFCNNERVSLLRIPYETFKKKTFLPLLEKELGRVLLLLLEAEELPHIIVDRFHIRRQEILATLV